MGTSISKADRALIEKLASKLGFSLVSTAPDVSVMPEVKVSSESLIDKLNAQGNISLEIMKGYRCDKVDFAKLREFATANHLKINTKSVIIDLTPE